MKSKHEGFEHIIRNLRTAELLIQGQSFVDACSAL